MGSFFKFVGQAVPEIYIWILVLQNGAFETRLKRELYIPEMTPKR